MVWVAGHFGEWVQGCLGENVALVTLACPTRGVEASWQEAHHLVLDDRAGLVGPERAGAFLAALGLSERGLVRIAPDLPAGVGAGMSTAALVAVARAAGAAEDRIAMACLAVEGAVDPVMLPVPDAILWAPREAVTLARMSPPPRADILGGLWGPPMPTDPRDTAFPEVHDLVAAWAAGPDLPQAARLASLSAARTTALRGPEGDPTADLVGRLGALGWARAHTGSARALIFPPGAIPANGETVLREAGYDHVFRFRTGCRP
ncbi:hypothetical protein [Rhodosalinus sp.]|uniref:hypothetical protein n=1 Tax=Rhodosalinus sp. TaxID=2047741 RepID=UPI00397E265D